MKPSPFAECTFEQQLIIEVRAMAAHALGAGIDIKPSVYSAVVQLHGVEKDLDPAMLSATLKAHEALRRALAPARPLSVALLAAEAERPRRFDWLPSLGPVRLVRHLTICSVIFLVVFVALGLSSKVSRDSGGILDSSGSTLLLNLLFILSAAGLGAVFAALFRVGRYIATLTFDPLYEASYWINLVLGLIAGLLLAELIPEVLESSDSAPGEGEFNFARPLLALVGGFSATVVFRILRKLVDAVESVFVGDAKSTVAAQVEAAKASHANQQTEDRLALSAKLVKLQQTINSAAGTAEIASSVTTMLDELLPLDTIAEPAPDAASDPV